MYYKLLENGKIDDVNTKSEYERGFIDCWNKFFVPANDWEIKFYQELLSEDEWSI